MHTLTDKPFTAYVGIDWADSKHDICVQATGGQQREFDCISHQVDQIEQWAQALHTLPAMESEAKAGSPQ